MTESDNNSLSPPPVSLALNELGVAHQVFVHPGPVTSLEQAADERGQLLEQVVRSILFRLAKGQYAMVLVSGPNQISWKKLRSYLNLSRISTASREEVLAATSFELGAVAPFALPAPMRVLIDAGVLEMKEISIGSGVRGTAVILSSADLLRALPHAEIGRFMGAD